MLPYSVAIKKPKGYFLMHLVFALKTDYVCVMFLKLKRKRL